MIHQDFVAMLTSTLGVLISLGHLRQVQASGDRMVSSVILGNEYAGLQFSLEWRDLHMDVQIYRTLQGQLPPRSGAGPSPHWISLRELVDLGGVHPLEEPRLTATGSSEDFVVYSTPKDLQAYLSDLVPLLLRSCTPWFRGSLESFEALVQAREALLAEPEPGATGAAHWTWTEELNMSPTIPVFVAGMLDACGPLRREGWRDVWYAATPRKLAMALTHPNGQVGVEVRVREPRPPEAQVELLLLEAGRPPLYERLDRRVAIKWALEVQGAAVPTLSRKDGVGLYKSVGESISALTRSSPGFLSGDGRIVQEAQVHRDQVGESLGAEFR